MTSLFLRKIAGLDLEEKILHIAVIASLLGIFFPWIEGRWMGSDLRSHTGFGFYTSFIGLSVFALNVYIIAITVAPMFGKQNLVSKQNKESFRLYCSIASTILVLAALSVLTKVTSPVREPNNVVDMAYQQHTTTVRIPHSLQTKKSLLQA